MHILFLIPIKKRKKKKKKKKKKRKNILCSKYLKYPQTPLPLASKSRLHGKFTRKLNPQKHLKRPKPKPETVPFYFYLMKHGCIFGFGCGCSD